MRAGCGRPSEAAVWAGAAVVAATSWAVAPGTRVVPVGWEAVAGDMVGAEGDAGRVTAGAIGRLAADWWRPERGRWAGKFGGCGAGQAAAAGQAATRDGWVGWTVAQRWIGKAGLTAAFELRRRPGMGSSKCEWGYGLSGGGREAGGGWLAAPKTRKVVGGGSIGDMT